MATKTPEVKGKRLLKLRYDSRTYLNHWVRRGGKVTTYFCPGCRTHRRTMRPAVRAVGRKGCWTSAKTCTRCGEIHFVSTWASGKTVVRELPKMQTTTVPVSSLSIKEN